MLYYENTMNNTKNIILITSIAAVLGFGIVAFQTNTVDALMDNTSEILDLGEKSEITTLAKPEGKGKKESLAGEGISADTLTTVKCSASNILKCTIKNSGEGINSVAIGIDKGTVVNCDTKDVKDGASRASIDTRGTDCKFDPLLIYQVDVSLAPDDGLSSFSIWVETSEEGNSLKIAPVGSIS